MQNRIGESDPQMRSTSGSLEGLDLNAARQQEEP